MAGMSESVIDTEIAPTHRESESRSLPARLEAARDASRPLAQATADAKNRALLAIAAALRESFDLVGPANDLDLENARSSGVRVALQDRLRLDAARLASLADAVEQVVALTDPIGQVVRGSTFASQPMQVSNLGQIFP